MGSAGDWEYGAANSANHPTGFTGNFDWISGTPVDWTLTYTPPALAQITNLAVHEGFLVTHLPAIRQSKRSLRLHPGGRCRPVAGVHIDGSTTMSWAETAKPSGSSLAMQIKVGEAVPEPGTWMAGLIGWAAVAAARFGRPRRRARVGAE